jgi:hypothetical protein
MALNVYRVYYLDNILSEEKGHLFSIVTTENSGAYAIPADKNITEFEQFNDERVEEILTITGEKPTTPEDWALLLSRNMSQLDVIKVDDVDYETPEEAILSESYRAEDAWYFRNPEGTTAVTAAATQCPPATQDIALNLKNRKNAIDTAMYGPLNPEEPNEEYWQTLANEWKVDVETAKKQRCGNCAVFVVTTDMKNCISQGLTGENQSDEFDAIDAAGELGYCEAFDFKCAAARTCRAWVAGGPVDDNKIKEQ